LPKFECLRRGGLEPWGRRYVAGGGMGTAACGRLAAWERRWRRRPGVRTAATSAAGAVGQRQPLGGVRAAAGRSRGAGLSSYIRVSPSYRSVSV
jgi:hypothetical protein